MIIKWLKLLKPRQNPPVKNISEHFVVQCYMMEIRKKNKQTKKKAKKKQNKTGHSLVWKKI